MLRIHRLVGHGVALHVAAVVDAVSVSMELLPRDLGGLMRYLFHGERIQLLAFHHTDLEIIHRSGIGKRAVARLMPQEIDLFHSEIS